MEEESWVVAVTDSPKPPPERITFTFPVLLNAHCAVFAACGAGKAAMVQSAKNRHTVMDEDEVVFDRASMLSSRRDGNKPNTDVCITTQHIKTLCLSGAFFALGLCLALPGPTLNDLEETTHTNTSQISWIFTGRSGGYLVGSIIGGFLFDRLNQQLLISVTLTVTAMATALAPWCQRLTPLVVLILFQGVSMGLLDTGGNQACLMIWGRDSAVYMQMLHFSFALGAFLAPLVARPFLGPGHRGPKPPLAGGPFTTTMTTMSSFSTTVPVSATVTPVATPGLFTGVGTSGVTAAAAGVSTVLGSTIAPSNVTMSSVTALHNARRAIGSMNEASSTAVLTVGTNSNVDLLPSHVQSAYMVVAVVVFVVAIAFACLWIRLDGMRCKGTSHDMDAAPSLRSDYVVRKDRIMFRLQIIFGLSVFYFLYVGMEVAYGNLISTFSIRHPSTNYSPADGALLTSAFWGAFAVSRFAAIFLARWLSPTMMLTSDLVICTISLAILASGDRIVNYKMALSGCSATLGVGMASIFPAGISWAERYVKVTSFATSMFVVGSALGEMVLPGLCGVLLDKYTSPMSLMYVIFGCACASLMIFSLLVACACNAGERYLPGGELGVLESEDRLPLVNDEAWGADDEEVGGGAGVVGKDRKKRVMFDSRTVVNGEMAMGALTVKRNKGMQGKKD